MEPELKPIEDIISDPAAHFKNPDEVVGSEDLSVHLKQKILESWKAEAAHMAESASENMGGGESNRLAEVSRALVRLNSATIAQNQGS